MSTTFDRLRVAGAVAAGAGLLAWSGFLEWGGRPLLTPAVTAEQEAAVHRAVAVLRTGQSPLVDIDTCNGVKSLIPDQVSAADGMIKLVAPSERDVIICYRDDIDYADALAAVAARKLRWQAGIGGDRIIVFASSQARFMAVARENHIVLRPGDLQPYSPFMGKLVGNARSRLVDGAWAIQAGPESEALFGPYADLAPGAYGLNLTFAADGASACSALAQLRVTAAVTAEARQRTLVGRRPMALRPQSGPDCTVSGQIDFSVPAGTPAKAVETPIWVSSTKVMKLTGYDLQAR